jgi:hypothetical protein
LVLFLKSGKYLLAAFWLKIKYHFIQMVPSIFKALTYDFRIGGGLFTLLRLTFNNLLKLKTK